MPSATAILDRFLHHAEVVTMTGRSYRLRNKKTPTGDDDENPKPANLPTGAVARKKSKSAPNIPAADADTTCEA